MGTAPRGPQEPPQGDRPVCVRRRPILSCEEVEGEEPPGHALVRVVVLGGDRELGRLARAYGRLQRSERRTPRLTRRCRLHFFFVPARRPTGEGPALSDPPTEGPPRAMPTLVRTGAVGGAHPVVMAIRVITLIWYTVLLAFSISDLNETSTCWIRSKHCSPSVSLKPDSSLNLVQS